MYSCDKDSFHIKFDVTFTFFSQKRLIPKCAIIFISIDLNQISQHHQNIDVLKCFLKQTCQDLTKSVMNMNIYGSLFSCILLCRDKTSLRGWQLYFKTWSVLLSLRTYLSSKDDSTAYLSMIPFLSNSRDF